MDFSPDNSSEDLLNGIVAVFRDVLRHPEASPDDDFFDLGGDSLAATSLVMALEALGIQLPVAALFDTPTPAALAATIQAAGLIRHLPLVTLKTGDGAQPLFIAPGAGGSVLELGRMARGIETKRCIYGLQPRDGAGGWLSMDTVEQAASFYLALIRGAQPRGPYVLAGYSLGGMVALELAHALLAAGEQVSLLIVLDTLTPIEHYPLAGKFRFWLRRGRHHAAAAARLSWRQVLPYAALRMSALVRHFGDVKGDFRPRMPQQVAGGGPGPGGSAPSGRVIMEQAVATFLRYRPKRFPGTVVFIQSDGVGGKVQYPDILWTLLSRRLFVHRVRGDHYNMLTFDPKGIAAAMSAALNLADGDRHS